MSGATLDRAAIRDLAGSILAVALAPVPVDVMRVDPAAAGTMPRVGIYMESEIKVSRGTQTAPSFKVTADLTVEILSERALLLDAVAELDRLALAATNALLTNPAFVQLAVLGGTIETKIGQKAQGERILFAATITLGCGPWFERYQPVVPNPLAAIDLTVVPNPSKTGADPATETVATLTLPQT